MFPSSLLGSAGEHYVMSQLLRRSFIAALAPAGVPLADIIVTDEFCDLTCTLQVKTRRSLGSDGGWHMKRKNEETASQSLFYVFVSFGTDILDVPSVFVVPSKIVASVLGISHKNWLGNLGKAGKIRKDSEMRRFLPDYSKIFKSDDYGPNWLKQYENNWDQLRRRTA